MGQRWSHLHQQHTHLFGLAWRVFRAGIGRNLCNKTCKNRIGDRMVKGLILSALKKIAFKMLTERAIIDLVDFLIKKLKDSTENTIDDDFYELYKKHVND